MHILYVTPMEYLNMQCLNDRCSRGLIFDEVEYDRGLVEVLKLTTAEHDLLLHLRNFQVVIQYGIDNPIINRIEIN